MYLVGGLSFMFFFQTGAFYIHIFLDFTEP